MKRPFFSVIIPTYNRARSILDAVESVIAQTFEDFELIIIDDGSTDNTSEILKPVLARDERVKYVYQENAERSAARNHGIEIATGEYICFLDSDDVYLPNHLSEFQTEIHQLTSPFAMLVSNAVHEWNGEKYRVEPYETESDDPIELIIKTAIPSQLMCIHHSILNNQKFDTSLRVAEDQELWSRIIKHYPFIRCSHYSVVIRDLGDRTIDMRKTETYLANLKVKQRIIADDTEERIKPQWRKFALSAAYYKLAVSHLSNGKTKSFYKNILHSIISDPSHFLIDKLMAIGATIPGIRCLIKNKIPAFVKAAL